MKLFSQHHCADLKKPILIMSQPICKCASSTYIWLLELRVTCLAMETKHRNLQQNETQKISVRGKVLQDGALVK